MFEIFNDEDFFSKLEIVRNTCCLIRSNSSNNFFDSDKLIKHIVIDALKEKLKDLIINGIDNFIVGLENNFDIICIELLSELKGEYSGIKLICFCEEKNRKKYIEGYNGENILKNIDFFKIFENDIYINKISIIHKNMIDYSSTLIVFVELDDTTKSLTEYANLKHLNIIKLEKSINGFNILSFD